MQLYHKKLLKILYVIFMKTRFHLLLLQNQRRECKIYVERIAVNV